MIENIYNLIELFFFSNFNFEVDLIKNNELKN